MTGPARPYATDEDRFELPEHRVGEILSGELFTHPRPAPKQARAYSSLGGHLGGRYDWGSDGPGGWWILDEPELHLGDDIFVPEITGWRRERLPELPETAWFELAPDWACELLSPSTALSDRTLELAIHAREGVPQLWLVDPDVRTLEVYRLQGDGHWLLLATRKHDDPVSQPPFDAIGLPWGSLWA